MARLRVSRPARADLSSILATRLERWGAAGRARYRALLEAALRQVVATPTGPTSRARGELAPGLRSLHLRQARGAATVAAPVHVLYYRRRGEVVELVRVLHERMEPTLHLDRRPQRRR